MSQRNHVHLGALIACLGSTALMSACPAVAAPPTKVVGTYELFFVFDGELVLRAHIEDGQGNVATDGIVVFQYCSLKGLPPNDITQPDETSSAACADGTGRWRKLNARAEVNADGDAFLNFGTVSVVNVIGFRYRYSQGSEVEDWVTEPLDWVRSP